MYLKHTQKFILLAGSIQRGTKSNTLGTRMQSVREKSNACFLQKVLPRALISIAHAVIFTNSQGCSNSIKIRTFRSKCTALQYMRSLNVFRSAHLGLSNN